MPLSEFYRTARGNLDSSQQRPTTSSTDLFHLHDNEFVELVWENGQIMMQGQSSRARKSFTSTNPQSQTPKPQHKEVGNSTNSKIGKFGLMDSLLNDFAPPVPSGELALDQDDDMVPWLNYHIEDTLQHDYCSDLLPELSGVTVNELSAQNGFATIDKRHSSNQIIRGSHNGSIQNGLSLEQAEAPKVSSLQVGESSRPRSGQFFPFQESQTSLPSLRSGVTSTISDNSGNTKHAACGDFQKQDSGLPNSNSGIINFSYFSRPAALFRANLQNVGATTTPGTSDLGAVGGKNKELVPPSSSNFAESAPIDLSGGLNKGLGSHSQPNLVPDKVDPKLMLAKPIEESCNDEESEDVCRENAVKNEKLPNQVLGEKAMEPVVASSSVCSGNSADRASNDPMHNLKRKCRETDDSEGRSEDVDEESVGLGKEAPARRGSGSKRSRAAEVHNLSERRRRDRINEKMRALQELIPNCNKVDKASMLDEAIEYLKTLQLQVQIMSMGAGLYMPPMMLPARMQQVHAAHMAHFSPMGMSMGMGMGMGMGFGMGMMDMNGGSHFLGSHPSPMFGPAGFQQMAGPNLQVFGHPGQGLAMSALRAPLVPFSGGASISSAMELNTSRMAAPVEFPSSVPPGNPKAVMQNANSQMMHNTDASSSMNQASSQCRATNKGFDQSSLVSKNDQAPDVASSEDARLTKEADIIPIRTGCD